MNNETGIQTHTEIEPVKVVTPKRIYIRTKSCLFDSNRQSSIPNYNLDKDKIHIIGKKIKPIYLDGNYYCPNCDKCLTNQEERPDECHCCGVHINWNGSKESK